MGSWRVSSRNGGKGVRRARVMGEDCSRSPRDAAGGGGNWIRTCCLGGGRRQPCRRTNRRCRASRRVGRQARGGGGAFTGRVARTLSVARSFTHSHNQPCASLPGHECAAACGRSGRGTLPSEGCLLREDHRYGRRGQNRA